ncbi:MAG: Asp-tRNA(Asn)/Glu-tRNA(Gln) amidotransferase subunit GatC [Candidatus Dojkabacteria bacterium]|jgi:aspartyl-tRNA(Asn)/glutamyl-tRNA(Gln) amidotransferase subunit C|nr:Asp-tRNA(Asn)/Glu-tRNA(Gln) amidotransferase subunit GatC [Candidatus Dojkabacteria bacterium]MDD2270139.1 Asp-tRNA(Asn)/Glu-tRNA(Gln) amidotransferase subunit GatC [Candidatus Dojkabacteria bacterium]
MKIDIPFLKHIAELSRIKLTEKELEKFTPQMKTILDSADELQEVNVDGKQAMKKHVPFSTLREDEAGETLTQEEVLKNANYKELGLVKIYGKVFGDIKES